MAISGAVLTIEGATRTMSHVAALSDGLAVVGGNSLESLGIMCDRCDKKSRGLAALTTR